MKRACLFLVWMIAFEAGIFNFGWAERGEASDSTGILRLASSQWVSGKVQETRTCETYKDRFITLNDVQYHLDPEARIDRRVQRNVGAYNEVPGTFQDIRKGQSIMLRVQGFRVYKILIME